MWMTCLSGFGITMCPILRGKTCRSEGRPSRCSFSEKRQFPAMNRDAVEPRFWRRVTKATNQRAPEQTCQEKEILSLKADLQAKSNYLKMSPTRAPSNTSASGCIGFKDTPWTAVTAVRNIRPFHQHAQHLSAECVRFAQHRRKTARPAKTSQSCPHGMMINAAQHGVTHKMTACRHDIMSSLA